MTPTDIRHAREVLGSLWGYGRSLHASELARALRLGGRDPGRTVKDWEAGHSTISGPATVALTMMLAGAEPPDAEMIRTRRRA